MTDVKYWIWLSMALGPGARTDEVLAAYPSPEQLYLQSRAQRMMSGVFTKAKLDRLEAVELSEAEKAAEICEKNKWKIYTPESEDYPASLKTLTDMPLVLFCEGDLSCIKDKIAIGVVGTRTPSSESVKIAKSISRDAAGEGAVIVSGGAMGIDTAAHEGALSAGGVTVCVLGCGLGTRYLMGNAAMRSEIAEKGAVVTEYPPFAPAGRTTFPLRNRIISGLSNGVLVVEAGEKSGSLITAGFASEQGRDVFAVPGSILDPAYKGANRLIKDGAKVITCAGDMLEAYRQVYPEKLSQPVPQKEAPVRLREPEGLSPEALAVYRALGKEPVRADEICVKSGLQAFQVMAALTELELSDYAQQTEGKGYILS
ncbi:MAG: DNA-processing protein DprA [Clostridia bacterium]|nr:DNA-processing protein DprA [Clostridia bacterium]MBR5772254.1 DNA-processing protein DprA [Clostridia bacterium]